MAKKKKTEKAEEEFAAHLNAEARAEADEREIVDYIVGLSLSSLDYMNHFTGDWNDVIGKIRCDPPSNWDQKEDWQTKVFIPMFAKGSEVAGAYLNKMLFHAKRFYSLFATKSELNKYTGPLMDLIDVILDRGRFTFNKNFALQEGIDIGTSFIKPLARADKRGIDFVWRSAYAGLCDVDARHDFYKSRFWIDNYRYDIHQMINDIRMGGNSLWTREAVDKLILDGAQDATDKFVTEYKSNTSEFEKNITQIQNIDSTANMTVTLAFANAEIFEYWGKVPVRKEIWDEGQKRLLTYYEYENRQITIANRKRIMKNEKMAYKTLPVFPLRTKKRPYDLYGTGFFLNCTGLQELGNSMIHLGFDSAKLCSLDFIVMDKSKINDADSIKYKPTQIWDVKEPQNVKITRPNNGFSAMTDALKGFAYIDSIFQDASSLTRGVQGAQALPGAPGGGDNTLGEFQYQLQMADQRLLDQAKFIEDDFEKPLLHFVLNCIIDPDLISQDFIDEVLGFTQEPEKDSNGQPTGLIPSISVLDQAELIKTLNEVKHKDKSADFDFDILGLNQFIEKVSILKKLDNLIERATTNQAFAPYVKVNAVVKRWYELSEIPNWTEFYNADAPAQPVFPPTVAGNGKIPGNPLQPNVAAKSQVQAPTQI